MGLDANDRLRRRPGVTVLVPAVALYRVLPVRRAFSTAAEQATYNVLHKANEAAPPFRAGLTRPRPPSRSGLSTSSSAARRWPSPTRPTSWPGTAPADHHGVQAAALAAGVVASGRAKVVPAAELNCTDPYCPIRSAVIVPIVVGDDVVGTLGAFGSDTRPGLIRATTEVARWVSTQVELAELDVSRARLAEAEVRALRAQISPHFIFNAMTAIASFVRSDPERARELLLEFADFTRYSFRSHGQFTTLAEELRSIDKYLVLERARFGDRLQVTLQIAPEVLPVAVPVFVLQPLVENAVRHGLEKKPGQGHITHRGRRRRPRGPDHGGGRRRGHGPSARPLQPGRPQWRHRPGQRRRAAPHRLRRRLRPGGRDRARRRHEGEPADSQVPQRGAGVVTAHGRDAFEVLVVDDEQPALEDLAYLLRQHPRIGSVVTASDATEALRRLRDGSFAAVFLDIRMPGLDGLELARMLSRFARRRRSSSSPPSSSTPSRPSSCRRSTTSSSPSGPNASPTPSAASAPRPGAGDDGAADGEDLDRIAVEMGGRTRIIERDSIRFVEASGDYVRLHSDDGAFLVRMPISSLEDVWRGAGFVRVHRRYLVPLRHLTELRSQPGRRLRPGRRRPGAARQPPPRPRAPGPARPRPRLGCRRDGTTSDGHHRRSAGASPSATRGAGPPGRRRRASGPWPSSGSRPRSATSCSGRSPGPSSCWPCGSSPSSGSSSSACPPCSPAPPGLAGYRVLGLPLPWLVLGGAVYPLLVLLGLLYVRQAERNEREFVEFIERLMDGFGGGRWPRCWRRPSPPSPSAPTGCGWPAPPPTSSSPPGPSRPLWNASAISGEYLSAASFLGVAGLVMKYGVDMLWYPVGFAAGYLVLLLLVAAPLRRFGAYTIPDFAEGRLDSLAVRRLATAFVLLIGWFYLLPQMKGAGVTLRAILGTPYWVGVVGVGALITANVFLGGMKGITFVQAFQYWLKVTAISLPAIVLLLHYQADGSPRLTGPAPPAFRTETVVDVRVDARFEVAQPTPVRLQACSTATATAGPATRRRASRWPRAATPSAPAPRSLSRPGRRPPRRRAGHADGRSWSRPFGPLERRAEPPAVLHLLADPGHVPGHHGAAPHPRPLLHQPRRPGRPPDHPDRARAARRLLRLPRRLRRARPRSTPPTST